ncbi:MAG TPA: 2Fe-2S iron-sulfur cluster-binding protein [Steroidobacteraceae bacterium]
MELTIDDRTIEARSGESVLQAALRHGIEIPHFCYHPHLSIAGACRICLVKVEGVPKLMAACNLSVAPNMKVTTLVPEVGRAREHVMQFLMLNHPVDCGICDKAGECRLQDYEYAYGLPRSRSTDAKHHKRKLHDLSPRIQLDNERCILCSRCVRFTREVSKSNMLGIVERGAHAFVERADPTSADDPYSDNVIGLCPTGALLSRDFLYQSRVWFLEPVRSVCTGCSRGCSIDLWRRKKEWRQRSLGEERNSMVYRVTAHENPEINGPWLCNKGFDQHKLMSRERTLTPMLGDAAASIDEALARARDLIAGARSPAALVSALASNEELDAFKRTLGAHFRVYAREDSVPQPEEVVEDDFLIKSDKNPNSHGVRERFGWRALTPTDAQAHDLFFIWGDWGDYESFGHARVIHLASFARQRDRHADVHIPLSTTFERSGTFSNFEGKQNRFEKVLDKPPLVQHAEDVFAQLQAQLVGPQRHPEAP